MNTQDFYLKLFLDNQMSSKARILLKGDLLKLESSRGQNKNEF